MHCFSSMLMILFLILGIFSTRKKPWWVSCLSRFRYWRYQKDWSPWGGPWSLFWEILENQGRSRSTCQIHWTFKTNCWRGWTPTFGCLYLPSLHGTFIWWTDFEQKKTFFWKWHWKSERDCRHYFWRYLSKQLFQLPRLSVLPPSFYSSVCPRTTFDSCCSVTKCH